MNTPQTLSLVLTATTMYSASASGTRGAAGPAIHRIVGGDEVDFGSYPFYVSLSFCGGSLIWKDIVLSAAHCNVGQGRGPDMAMVGTNQIPIRIISATDHPNYSNVTSEWDFKILKLESTVEGVAPVELATDQDNESNDPLVVIGMGDTAEGAGVRSPSLQEVNLDYVPRDICQEQYSQWPVTNAMICAGGEEGTGGCHGDSGGPAIQGNRQVGVTSWSVGCARPNNPTVFARVASARNWIQEMVCCLSSSPPDSCGDIDKSKCPDDNGSDVFNDESPAGELAWDDGNKEIEPVPLFETGEIVTLVVVFAALLIVLFLKKCFRDPKTEQQKEER